MTNPLLYSSNFDPTSAAALASDGYDLQYSASGAVFNMTNRVAYFQSGITGYTGSFTIGTGPVWWNNANINAGTISQNTNAGTGSSAIVAGANMVCQVSYSIQATGVVGPKQLNWMVSQRLQTGAANGGWTGVLAGTGIPQSVAMLQSVGYSGAWASFNSTGSPSGTVIQGGATGGIPQIPQPQVDLSYLVSIPSGYSIQTYIQPLGPNATGIQLSATGTNFSMFRIG